MNAGAVPIRASRAEKYWANKPRGFAWRQKAQLVGCHGRLKKLRMWKLKYVRSPLVKRIDGIGSLYGGRPPVVPEVRK